MTANSDKREAALEKKKKFIAEAAPHLCVIDEQQKIDLLYFIMTGINDDQCAEVHDTAKKILFAGMEASG